jgi:hypothetical protein
MLAAIVGEALADVPSVSSHISFSGLQAACSFPEDIYAALYILFSIATLQNTIAHGLSL